MGKISGIRYPGQMGIRAAHGEIGYAVGLGDLIFRSSVICTLLLISGDPMTRLLFAGSDQFANLGAFSADC